MIPSTGKTIFDPSLSDMVHSGEFTEITLQLFTCNHSQNLRFGRRETVLDPVFRNQTHQINGSETIDCNEVSSKQ